MAELENLYELLGLPEDASPEEIRRAYHQAALRHHPDVHRGETELFIQAQQAYEVLSDPNRRSLYDEQLQKQAAENSFASIRTIYSRAALACLSEPQILYTLLSLSPEQPARETPLPERIPFNLCLVLDRSTSMRGERLDSVKAAAIELIRQLGPKDLLSIVTFSDRADLLIPAERRVDFSQVNNRIRMIRAAGGTEIFQGLELGFREIRRRSNQPYIHHLVLVTDGRTYGDEQACLELAEQAARSSIGISSLGLGEDWNDQFLDDLIARAGGTCTYLSQPGGLQDYLSERLCILENTYATGVQIQLQMAPEVQLRSAFRLEPEAAPLKVEEELKLGGLPGDGQLRVLLELLVQPLQTETNRFRLATGRLQFTLPGKPANEASMIFTLSRPVQAVSEEEDPPAALVRALSQINLYRMQERARKDLEEGDVKSATQRLQRLASQLTSQGDHQLAETVMFELENLHRTHNLTAQGEKGIKYGTRALLLPSQKENSS